MLKWNGGVTTTLGLWMAMVGMASAQSKPAPTLTDKDRAEIRQLSDSYVTALDGCKATEYANLFTADGSFISGPRGTMTGHEKLESLVTTERHCQPGATAAQRDGPRVQQGRHRADGRGRDGQGVPAGPRSEQQRRPL